MNSKVVPIEEEPYFVEVDLNGCAECGAGRHWTVVGPDGVAIGRSFADEEFTSSLADDLNAAYFAGRSAAPPDQTESAAEKELPEEPEWSSGPSEDAIVTYAKLLRDSAVSRIAEQAAEIENLKHDIARHIAIAAEEATELTILREELARVRKENGQFGVGA